MLRLICLLTFVLLALVSAAQPAGGPVMSEPTAMPLDAGAGLLLTGGLAYGLRQLRARRP